MGRCIVLILLLAGATYGDKQPSDYTYSQDYYYDGDYGLHDYANQIPGKSGGYGTHAVFYDSHPAPTSYHDDVGYGSRTGYQGQGGYDSHAGYDSHPPASGGYYHQAPLHYQEQGYGHRHSKPHKKYVPVVIKKKKNKKRKTLTTYAGFYTEGGVQMYGKFADLYSCQKACEITPTCFAADYNKWLHKCYFHGNVTACASMKAHPAITHLKKVPCDVLGSERGLVILGSAVTHGLEQVHVHSLQECVKRCTSAGNGVAPLTTGFNSFGQLCCGVNYDFANHKCYFITCPSTATLLMKTLCPDPVPAPLNSFPLSTSVIITICPRSAA